jgi:hypothetical protein
MPGKTSVRRTTGIQRPEARSDPADQSWRGSVERITESRPNDVASLGRTGGAMLAAALVASLLFNASPAAAAITAPTPFAPLDAGTLSFPTEPPLFQWLPVDGAKSYRVEIDDAPDFIGAISASTVNTSYTLTEPQTIGQPFFWHVQATSPSGAVSDWSPTWSYEIEWPDSGPTLVEPALTESVEDVAFRWEPVAGASTYHLQVSPNADWSNNVVIDLTVKGTSYSRPDTLDNATYFWRVRARDAAVPPNLGEWSEEGQFTRTWSDAPTPFTPADTVAVSVETPTFAWTPIAHASHYEVQLGDDVNFSPGTFSICFTNHTELTYLETETSTGPAAPGTCQANDFEATPGQVIFWRVRGVDEPEDVLSPWSGVSQFLFRGDASDAPALNTPADGSTVETPLLSWDSVSGIGKYKVTIVKPGGSSVTATTAATSWTPTTKLASSLPAGAFTWTVQTVDSYGELGIVGEQRSFMLDPATTSDTLDLLTPADGATGLVMPSMTWTPLTGAEYYEVWYSVAGSGVEQRLSGSSELPYGGFTYTGDPLTPGDYTWRVKAFDGSAGTPMAVSASRDFSTTTIGVADYVGPCSVAQTPCTVKDTPTFAWDPKPGAGQYLVYLAQDENFTNVVKIYRTQYTTLTPRESLLDNQAGNAYYWFVRPCITAARCGKFDATVFDEAFAFRKVSNAVGLESPSDGATVQDLVTFEWTDYLETNLADASMPTQEAERYRIQVSTVADFATILDDKTVDQTTYTPFDRTYPEGTLYWRVQAIDGSGNALTRSVVRTVVKSSPTISLQNPAADVELIGGLPYFTWTPQDYAAKYELEVYENGDLAFAPANKVLGQQTKMSAWAPTKALDPGVYAWRIRRLDADNKAGPWSDGRRFTLSKEATTTTVGVVKTDAKVKASGTLTPPLADVEMSVTLSRRQNGRWVKIAEKSPVVKAGGGGFSASFARSKRGDCRVIARFAGDDLHEPSKDTATFRC